MVGEMMGYPSGKGSSKSRGAWKEYWIIENLKNHISLMVRVPWFPSAAGVNKSWCLIIFSRLTTPTRGSTMSLQEGWVLKEYCNKKKSVQHCNTVSTCEIICVKTHLKVAAYKGGQKWSVQEQTQPEEGDRDNKLLCKTSTFLLPTEGARGLFLKAGLWTWGRNENAFWVFIWSLTI